MKTKLGTALMYFVATTLFWIVVLAIIPWEETDHYYYNCDLAEISPDFPPKAREECRDLRREQWIKQHRNTSI
jgi:hypothetical protein